MTVDFKQLDKFRIDDFVKDCFIGMCQNILGQNEGEFKWDTDENISKIVICDQFSYNDLNTNFKPTIYTRRRPISFMNTSIDQMMSKNLNNGSTVYTDMLSGVIELVSVAREGLQANRLAGMVFILMQEAKVEFRKIGMHDISVKTLGEEEPKDIGAKMRIVEVPVTIQFAFQYTWAMTVIGGTILQGITAARSKTLTTGGSSATNGSSSNDGSNGSGGSGSGSGTVYPPGTIDGVPPGGCLDYGGNRPTDGTGTTPNSGSTTTTVCVPLSSE